MYLYDLSQECVQTSAQLGPFLELVILVLEDSRGTSWFVSATKREPYRTVRAHICVLPSPCPATRNLSFLEVSPAPSPCCFNSLFHWTGTGWCENSTRWESRKRARARGSGAWACLAHGLQCLCDGRACCPARAMQLVICRSSGFTGAVTILFPLVVSPNWYGLG